MKKIVIIICTCLFNTTATFCQDSIPGTLLWEVSGNGLKQPSYLFGTNHLFGSAFWNSLMDVQSYFNNVDAIVGEFNSKSGSEKIATPENENINTYVKYDSIFSAKDYETLQNYLFGIGDIPLNRLDSAKFPAWRLYAFIQGDYINKLLKISGNEEQAIDFYLQDLAGKSGKEIIGLDNLSPTKKIDNSKIWGSPQQIGTSIMALVDYIQNGTITPEISRMVEEIKTFEKYRSFEINYQFTSSPPYKNTAIIQQLLIDRNKAWIKVLPDLLRKKRNFVAVGIMHLMYKEGLIVQLRKKGFKVTPVKMENLTLVNQ
ncbi:TraB/GumN family protein [Chitinophaga silvatica]|uniref:TraB/GumN family protein n=1 Tax=Chitinophaga silvatica TaxID=2282649 RepID=A0A3E1YHP1_9BACT|nr:TraB/GumN family protein [Chitinophaga silvatica]RFS26886.1 TraB/GumN family protein [Chitinophaga silvatica]